MKRSVEEWEKLDRENKLESSDTLWNLTKEEVEYCGGDCDQCITEWCPHNITKKE